MNHSAYKCAIHSAILLDITRGLLPATLTPSNLAPPKPMHVQPQTATGDDGPHLQ